MIRKLKTGEYRLYSRKKDARTGKRRNLGCESAWNKDPLFGVIGIQSGPRGRGSTVASMIHGGRDWDAHCGDDCEDPPGVFRAGEVDQGDLP